MKALLACAALLCASTTQSDIPPTAAPAIVQVDCLIGAGTAFRVGPRTTLSVNHVTSLDGCFINKHAFTVIRHEGDFSIVREEARARTWLQVDCGGFIKGRKYRAIGFARGLPTLTEVDLTATGESDDGFAILTGVFTVVPGQSGGPIVDAETGKVVGTVNVFNMISGMSGSVELKGTPVCSKK